MTRKRAIVVVAGAALVLVIYVLAPPPSGRGSMKEFEPTRLANLELRMWQAYYAKQNVRLFALLVEMQICIALWLGSRGRLMHAEAALAD